MNKIYYRYDHQKQFQYGDRIPEGNWRVYVGEEKKSSLDRYTSEESAIADYFFPAEIEVEEDKIIIVDVKNRKTSSLIGKGGCIIKFNERLFKRKIIFQNDNK
jgi:predicted PilT family ATPase